MTSQSSVTLTLEMRTFLNKLRRQGVLNMYGAAPFLQSMFNLTSTEASRAIAEWMETFTDADR